MSRHYRNPDIRAEHFRHTLESPNEFETENTRKVNARLTANGRCPTCRLIEPHECLESTEEIAGSRKSVVVEP